MTVTIPPWMLKSSISVEAYSGESGNGGAVYASPVAVKAHVEPRRRLIIGRDGKEVRTEMFALTAPGENIPPESRITYGGRIYRAVDTFEVPSPGGGVHHLEVAMS